LSDLLSTQRWSGT